MELDEIRRRMREGMLYNSGDTELLAVQAKCLEKMYDYNATRPSEGENRAALIKEMFGSAGDGCYIEPPFHANWGGKNVHLGDNVYANFNLTCVDDCEIFIGDGTMLGPSVVLASASHPICPELRKKAYQFNLPVRIGKNCWLGAGVVVLPGVTVGDNTVVGAGSVVTHDLPANVVAVGSPARVLRPISERDYDFYYHDRPIDDESKKDM